jgi:hypothetical protein
LPQSEVRTQSYGLPKLQEFQFREFRDFNLGVLGQNDIWAKHKEYYKGKVVASSKSRLWWVLWIRARGLSMHQKCSNYALTNLLFSLCKSMWIIDPFVTHSNPHPRVATCRSIPEMLWAKERAPISYPSIIFTLNSHLSLSRVLGVHQFWSTQPHSDLKETCTQI